MLSEYSLLCPQNASTWQQRNEPYESQLYLCKMRIGITKSNIFFNKANTSQF
jgi:hypothetical protein